MESFVSNENKSILWGVLQENNIFQGIDDNNFKDVKKIFEDTIFKKKNDYKESLIELNKETVAELIKDVNNYKQQSNSKISMIYKAADFQNNRRDELNKKMKLQEDDMNKMLNPGVPGEISFSDENIDKPLGDNIERAIADMQASRERELEKLPMDKIAAEKWINNGNKSENVKKNVTFKQEDHDNKGNQDNKDSEYNQDNQNSEYNQDNQINEYNQDNQSNKYNQDNQSSEYNQDNQINEFIKIKNEKETSFDIFSKLKKKSEFIENKTPINGISNSELFKEILEIKQTLKELKELIENKNK